MSAKLLVVSSLGIMACRVEGNSAILYEASARIITEVAVVVVGDSRGYTPLGLMQHTIKRI